MTKILILGAGNIMKAFAFSNISQNSSIQEVDIVAPSFKEKTKIDLIKKEFKNSKQKVAYLTSVQEVSKKKKIDHLLLAIKPQMIEEAIENLGNIDVINKKTIITSVMAGIKQKQIKDVFAKNLKKDFCPQLIVRIMPQIPAGVVGVYSNDPSELGLARSFINKKGEVIKLKEEKELDSYTASAGSGPAFSAKYILNYLQKNNLTALNKQIAKEIIFSSHYFQNNWIVEVAESFSKEKATSIVNLTFLASLDYLIEKNILEINQIDNFIANVSSLNGITITGLIILEHIFSNGKFLPETHFGNKKGQYNQEKYLELESIIENKLQLIADVSLYKRIVLAQKISTERGQDIAKNISLVQTLNNSKIFY